MAADIAHAAEWVLFNFGYGLGRLTGHLLGIALLTSPVWLTVLAVRWIRRRPGRHS